MQTIIWHNVGMIWIMDVIVYLPRLRQIPKGTHVGPRPGLKLDLKP